MWRCMLGLSLLLGVQAATPPHGTCSNSNPCGSHGTCTYVTLDDYYFCTCSSQFSGLLCETQIDATTHSCGDPAIAMDDTDNNLAGSLRGTTFYGVEMVDYTMADMYGSANLPTRENGWKLHFDAVDQAEPTALKGDLLLPPYVTGDLQFHFSAQIQQGTAGTWQRVIFSVTTSQGIDHIEGLVRSVTTSELQLLLAPDKFACKLSNPPTQYRAFRFRKSCPTIPAQACTSQHFGGPGRTLFSGHVYHKSSIDTMGNIVFSEQIGDLDAELAEDYKTMTIINKQDSKPLLTITGNINCRVDQSGMSDTVVLEVSVPKPSMLSQYSEAFFLSTLVFRGDTLYVAFDGPFVTCHEPSLAGDLGDHQLYVMKPMTRLTCKTPTCNPALLREAYPESYPLYGTGNLIATAPSTSLLLSTASTTCESAFNVVSALAYRSMATPAVPYTGFPSNDQAAFALPCPKSVTQINFLYQSEGRERTCTFNLKRASPSPVSSQIGAALPAVPPAFLQHLPASDIELNFFAQNPNVSPLHPSASPYSLAGIRSFVMDGVVYDVNQKEVLIPRVDNGDKCEGVRQHWFGAVAVASDTVQVMVAVVVQETSTAV